MKTYKNIEEFIIEAFPIEHQTILIREKSSILEYIEEADADFKQKLEAIIKGEKKDEEKPKNEEKTGKEEKPKNKEKTGKVKKTEDKEKTANDEKKSP